MQKCAKFACADSLKSYLQLIHLKKIYFVKTLFTIPFVKKNTQSFQLKQFISNKKEERINYFQGQLHSY